MKNCNKCNNKHSVDLFRVRKNRSGNLYRIMVCIFCERKQKRFAELKRYKNFSEEQKTEHRKRSIESAKKIQYKNWRKKWQKEKESSDIFFKLKRRISALLRLHLKKRNSILNIFEYSIQELFLHLESLFESWMTWDNWGIYNIKTWDDNDSSTWKWQIDHIIPISFFNYTLATDDEFKKCWALDNLRPLSAKENILKSNKFSEEI